MHPKPVAVSSRGGIFNSLFQISTAFGSEMPANPPLRVPRTVAENLGWILRIPSRRGQVGITQSKASCDIAAFASSSLWGKFGGLHACGAPFRYFVPLPNIFLTRLFSEQRLKRLPGDSPAGLGAGGPGFKSRRPDQNISRVFFSLLKALFTKNPTVEIPQTGGLDSQVV
jgi:hypothetical protein